MYKLRFLPGLRVQPPVDLRLMDLSEGLESNNLSHILQGL